MFFDYDNGYTRGGRDVESSVNMLFKGLLLFPVFILAFIVGTAMLKHIIFNGIPTMNRPTNDQIERLKERDANIGNPYFEHMRVLEEKEKALADKKVQKELEIAKNEIHREREIQESIANQEKTTLVRQLNRQHELNTQDLQYEAEVAQWRMNRAKREACILEMNKNIEQWHKNGTYEENYWAAKKQCDSYK